MKISIKTTACLLILLLLAIVITVIINEGKQTEQRTKAIQNYSEIDIDSLHDAQMEADQKAIHDRQKQEGGSKWNP